MSKVDRDFVIFWFIFVQFLPTLPNSSFHFPHFLSVFWFVYDGEEGRREGDGGLRCNRRPLSLFLLLFLTVDEAWLSWICPLSLSTLSYRNILWLLLWFKYGHQINVWKKKAFQPWNFARSLEWQIVSCSFASLSSPLLPPPSPNSRREVSTHRSSCSIFLFLLPSNQEETPGDYSNSFLLIEETAVTATAATKNSIPRVERTFACCLNRQKDTPFLNLLEKKKRSW